jgi:hypothetical protein
MKEENYTVKDMVSAFIKINEKLYFVLKKYNKIFIACLILTTLFDLFVTLYFCPNLSLEGNFFISNILRYTHSLVLAYATLLVIDIFPIMVAGLIITEKGKTIGIIGKICSITICLMPFVHIVGGLTWLINP